LGENGIKASQIGEVKERSFGIKIITDENIRNLKFSAKDELTKIFE